MSYLVFALIISFITSTIISYSSNLAGFEKIGFYTSNIAVGSFIAIMTLIITDIFYIVLTGI